MEEKQMLEFFASKQDMVDLKEDLKQEMTKNKSEILTGLDKQTEILRRADQERVFTIEHIRRIEERVELAEKDIKVIKVRLAIT